MPQKIEIMAPVGSYESLMAAIHAGADAVYFGVEQLNMRARATNNFRIEDIQKIVTICKKNNVKSYLTLNTIMYDHDSALIKQICNKAKEAEISAIIASDMAAILYARSLNISVHGSTQVNIANSDAVRFYAQYCDTIVLARELTLQQIKKICQTIEKEQIKGPSGKEVQIEVFVHGALCVAIAGKCYMSLATDNASANRGACVQNCRRAYKVTDEETGDELVIDNKYVMSPKDLCTIGFLDKILQSGVSVLKIEGRGKPPEYVATVTQVYKEALHSYYDNCYTPEKIQAWIKKLETVYNRGFWQGGYYLGKKLGEWSGTYGSQATNEKWFVGIVKNYYPKAQMGECIIQSDIIVKGDKILIMGPTTGVVEVVISNMRSDEKGDITEANKGDIITIPLKEKVRKNDKIYVIKGRKADG